MRIDCNSLDKIPELNSEIHDMWFSVDMVDFDGTEKEFRLFFGPDQKEYNRCLIIRRVLECLIKDTERIGIYDINYLSVNSVKGVVSIVGCIPISITLKVAPDFEIITEQNINKQHLC
jgi:hypothetical protein